MANDDEVGFGSPPKSNQFQKGQSGNPKGRSKGSRNRELPYETVLGQTVTIRENGLEREMTAEEAFLLHLTRRGLGGDNTANRYSLGIIQKAKELRKASDPQLPSQIVIKFNRIGIDEVLQPLRIAVLKYPADENRARWALQPWIVEQALKRLEWIGLSAEEQRIVWETTRTPNKVRWPDWFTYRPK